MLLERIEIRHRIKLTRLKIEEEIISSFRVAHGTNSNLSSIYYQRFHILLTPLLLYLPYPLPFDLRGRSILKKMGSLPNNQTILQYIYN